MIGKEAAHSQQQRVTLAVISSFFLDGNTYYVGWEPNWQPTPMRMYSYISRPHSQTLLEPLALHRVHYNSVADGNDNDCVTLYVVGDSNCTIGDSAKLRVRV